MVCFGLATICFFFFSHLRENEWNINYGQPLIKDTNVDIGSINKPTTVLIDINIFRNYEHKFKVMKKKIEYDI